MRIIGRSYFGNFCLERIEMIIGIIMIIITIIIVVVIMIVCHFLFEIETFFDFEFAGNL